MTIFPSSNWQHSQRRCRASLIAKNQPRFRRFFDELGAPPELRYDVCCLLWEERMKLTIALIALTLMSALASANETPKFQVEPFWPKPLPDNWILGQVSGVAVASDDTIWVVHRPGTLLDDEKLALRDPPATRCCKPAPSVLQFDAEGNLKRSWGGPGAGYDWPKSEHGIHVDRDGNVWIAGNGKEDHQILKFSPRASS